MEDRNTIITMDAFRFAGCLWTVQDEMTWDIDKRKRTPTGNCCLVHASEGAYFNFSVGNLKTLLELLEERNKK